MQIDGLTRNPRGSRDVLEPDTFAPLFFHKIPGLPENSLSGVDFDA